MFKNITSNLVDIYNVISLKIKLAILGLIIIMFLTAAWFLIRSRNTVNDSPNINSPTVINNVRETISRIGNPFLIDNKSYISDYPFIINNKIGNNLFILDINTSMLYNDYYKNLFAADINIKETLANKPLYYTDSFQVFYNSEENRTINSASRMLNFNVVEINGQERWFFEEGEKYWISQPTTQLTGLKEIKRPTDVLPSFRKLYKIGPAKFLTSNTDVEQSDMIYTTFTINEAGESNVKQGKLNFGFLDAPIAPIDPSFVGAITTSSVLPDIYPLNTNIILQKSINNSEAVISFGDISDVQNAFIVESKTFGIKEFNSIYITCSAVERQKCWIYNPGLRSIIEIDSSMNKKTLNSTLEVDLTKLPESLKQTNDKDRLLRYNYESDELLFFYQGKWQSILRFS
jgi:hypothetical protein